MMSEYYIHVQNDDVAISKNFQHIYNKYRHFVGTSDGNGYVECLYYQFTDDRIVIVCDDSGLLKGLPILAVLKSGIPIHGEFLILGIYDSEFVPLRLDQLIVVLSEIKFINHSYLEYPQSFNFTLDK